MIRFKAICALWLILAIPVVAFCAARKAAKFPLTVKVIFSTSYDDNILKYSALDLNRFETNTEPFPAEITTTDDWINVFGVRLYRDFNLGHHVKFRPYYAAKISLFAVNQIKNYQSHNFIARFAYRSRAYLSLKYFYLPSFYLRAYKDHDWNAYHGAQFDLSRPSASLRLRLAPYEFEAELGRELIYYNSFFTEYDLEAIFWGLSAAYSPREDLDLALGYTFKSSDNVGFEQSAEVAQIDPSVDTEYGDASYEEDQYSLKLSYLLPLRTHWDWKASLDLRRALRYYQSALPLLQDPFHAGRQDRRDTFEPALSVSPLPTVELELRFTYDLRRTDSPDPSVTRIKNFDDRTFEFTLIYQVF